MKQERTEEKFLGMSRAEFLELLGDGSIFERFRESSHWAQQHASKLAREYPNSWVAVHLHDVVASGDSSEALRTELERLGIPQREMLVFYPGIANELLILPWLS